MLVKSLDFLNVRERQRSSENGQCSSVFVRDLFNAVSDINSYGTTNNINGK